MQTGWFKEVRVKSIDRFVDLSELRRELAPFYSTLGRPSIDPELMIRMLIVGYCFGIRSERRLCEEVHLNLAYRWFCRLGLDGDVPDHSTFSKIGMAVSARVISCELAPHKIRVNTLAPTFIETPMTRPFFQNEAFRTDTLNRIKLGRLGQLEDLTGAIVFLAGDAAALMTGSSLLVDGGWTAE